MSDWDQLCAAAVLGTARQPQTRPAVAGLPPGWLDAAPDAERALLRAAAALSLLRMAGAAAARPALSLLPAAGPESLAPAGAHAAAQLAQICREEQSQDLLLEWLNEAAVRGRRAPEALLPQLLVRGQRDTGLRASLAPVLGARGVWLAQCNPNWQYLLAAIEPALVPEEATARWSVATAAERQGLLRSLRATQPALGRELLASTWKADNADTRGKLLELLATGLSMEDEPFLESVLDERSQEVRQRAVDLLLARPDSALRLRAAERAKPLLQYSRGLLRSRIELQLPVAWDDAWKRDGIRKDLPAHRKDLGERGWWALQLLAMLPPSHWATAWSCEPAQLIARSEGDWQALLLEAWFLAARRCGDRAWPAIYLEWLCAQGDHAVLSHTDDCVEGLSDAELERCTLKELRRQRDPGFAATHLLRACAARTSIRYWDKELSLAYSEIVLRACRQESLPHRDVLIYGMEACVRRLSTAVASQLAEQLASFPAAARAVQYLERRSALLRAFAIDQGETK